MVHQSSCRLILVGRRSVERLPDDAGKVGFTIRLLDENRTWPKPPIPGNIGADEHMRDRPRVMNCLDGGDAAALTQAYINDHQIRLASCGGADSISLGGFDRAHVVPHPREHLGKQCTDDDIVLHHNDTQGWSRGRSASPVTRLRHGTLGSVLTSAGKVGDRSYASCGRTPAIFERPCDRTQVSSRPVQMRRARPGKCNGRHWLVQRPGMSRPNVLSQRLVCVRHRRISRFTTGPAGCHAIDLHVASGDATRLQPMDRPRLLVLTIADDGSSSAGSETTQIGGRRGALTPVQAPGLRMGRRQADNRQRRRHRQARENGRRQQEALGVADSREAHWISLKMGMPQRR